ncbi:MAG: GNAT family N-acetyltransferase [Alphaproteobacteria bacterium]|nr:GNAT family N-acetyltransferase [Alphaproteobacteria bacterium]
MTPSAALTFQDVTPQDEAALLAMARAFHAEDGHALSAAGERAVRAVCAGDAMARAWFLCEGGVRVGYAVLSLGFSIEHGGRDGFIDDLYLLPQARGRGLGRAAIDSLERIAAGHGVQALHLEVESNNARAAALYHRRGYRGTGRGLMSKRLAP